MTTKNMIEPIEMRSTLPMEVANGVASTTSKVWDILTASRNGDLEGVKEMVNDCPELIYAQYNYTPPIYFAVREGYPQLVEYILSQGALDPDYKTYPFLDTLLTIAEDRDYSDIVLQLQQYLNDPGKCKFRGDNGKIDYGRDKLHQEFENAITDEDLDKTEQLLKSNSELVLDETLFWSEGVLMRSANDNNRALVELLISYGAKVPAISKWGRFYYFKHYEIAALLMKSGMNPNHMTWHRVTLLHDMAQEGDIQKAALLLRYGAEINPIDDVYQSTPLGLAARWGNVEMVEFLLKQGADPNKSGASWATPLSWAKKKGHNDVENILKKAGAE